jgi:ribose transport system permease protein
METIFKRHQKTLGIAVLLCLIVFLTGIKEPRFLQADNISAMLRYTGLYGILAVAAAIVITTGGIDLSMGALIALAGVMLPKALMAGLKIEIGDYILLGQPMSPWLAILVVMIVSGLVGLFHGLMVTKVNLQPFLVTLCGLFIYRGLARVVAGDASWGLENKFDGLRSLAMGKTLGLPNPLVILLVLAFLVSILLHRTVYGRALLALGRNENAAKFSGIRVDRVKIVAYMLCGLITALGGMMFLFNTNSAVASNFGNSYELYAIAGAVLGGCSLRGGECHVLGVVLGAALLQFSIGAVLMLGVRDDFKFVFIGLFILLGVIADELLRRAANNRQAKEKAA